MINFKKLRFKNFLSYGNYWTEVVFNKNKMTLIQGKNGSGKTSIPEALVYSLFGVPYRNINKPNLLNSVNDRECLVEVEFDIGSKQFKVVRGIKPAIFEIYCNGSLLNQASSSKDYQKYLENSILKLNYKAFTQLVFLGSSNFIPFMKLPAADRREVIEELLDIRIFSRMNLVLKEKMAQIKEQIKAIDDELYILDMKKVSTVKLINTLEKRNEEATRRAQTEIEKNETIIRNVDQECGVLDTQISGLYEQVASLSSSKSKHDQFREIKVKLSDKKDRIKQSLDFYRKTNDCPTCKQVIDESFRQTSITQYEIDIKDLETGLNDLSVKLKQEEDKLNQIEALKLEISKLQTERETKKHTIVLCKQFIQTIQENAQQEKELDLDLKLAECKADLQKTEDKVKVNSEEKNKLIENRHYYDIATLLLKDTGIKTKIIKKYLPLINNSINKYLSAMDFFVNFNLDENFKEVIKSRHRDEFEYNSFSQGEKFRIDMALLMTWREISKKKNATNTNILILDEVFDSSLDANGTDEFLKLLKMISKNIFVFVISHKSDTLVDKFDGSLKVEKKGNFSYLK